MQDTIAPTPERLRHANAYLPPEQSQRAARAYVKLLDPFEQLFARERLSTEQFAAAKKLQRHFWGQMGVDVRANDEPSGHCADVCEYPTTYHAQKFADAERAIITASVRGPLMWRGLSILLAETGTVETVGRDVLNLRDRETASARGYGLISQALDLLVRHWGLSCQHRPPSR